MAMARRWVSPGVGLAMRAISSWSRFFFCWGTVLGLGGKDRECRVEKPSRCKDGTFAFVGRKVRSTPNSPSNRLNHTLFLNKHIPHQQVVGELL